MIATQPLAGKVALVTGATSGHGRAAAKALARLGADLVLLGRSPRLCLEVKREITAESGGRAPDVLLCDLASRSDIDFAAQEFLSWGRPLHILVNNAGIVSREREQSADGVELTMAVNYFSMFQLTLRLLGRIRESAPARIVNVSSDCHRIVSLDLDDIQLRRGYSWLGAYGRSKLAIVYFTIELAKKLQGTGVTVNAVDPGPVASNIAARSPGLVGPIATFFINRFFPGADRAAKPAVHLAASPEVEGRTGGYYRFWKWKTPSVSRKDPTVGEKLWKISAAMTGVDMQRPPRL